ncbi:MAG: phosphoribosylformylglycinamidine synthase subunit PurS [Peptococcaceae bacterium]|nr:phosphoribosylformylglycinamidine synthase subunit PurS [Peptococcaceae bacterium]
MLTAKVLITLKKSILDPQGNTIKRALNSMGYPEVADVRQGKMMEVKLNDMAREKAVAIVDEMCQKLLANPVIEEYSFELVED